MKNEKLKGWGLRMSNLIKRSSKNKTVLPFKLKPMTFGSYKKKITIAEPLDTVYKYTSEEVKEICDRLNPDYIKKYFLSITGAKVINTYLFVRADDFGHPHRTGYTQFDLNTFEAVNEWGAHDFPIKIKVGEYCG